MPWCILQASPDLVAEFLKAYIEGDGSLSSKRIEAVSSSVGLLRDIQLLMQSLGIASTIEEKTKSTWAVKQPYTLRTDTDINNIYKIGVVSKQRQVYLEKWEKFFNRPRVTPIRIGKTYRTHPVTKDTSLDLGYERVTALTRGKTEAVYDMRTAKAHFVANGLVVHNCHKEVTDFHGGEREEAGHGPKWRACMIKVGLHPSRYDLEGNENYMDDKEKKANQKDLEARLPFQKCLQILKESRSQVTKPKKGMEVIIPTRQGEPLLGTIMERGSRTKCWNVESGSLLYMNVHETWLFVPNT